MMEKYAVTENGPVSKSQKEEIVKLCDEIYEISTNLSGINAAAILAKAEKLAHDSRHLSCDGSATAEEADAVISALLKLKESVINLVSERKDEDNE